MPTHIISPFLLLFPASLQLGYMQVNVLIFSLNLAHTHKNFIHESSVLWRTGSASKEMVNISNCSLK